MSDSFSPLSALVARVQGGGTPPREISGFWHGPIPWASVKDVSKCDFELHDTLEHISQGGLSSSSANLVPAGTPVIATRMAVGKAVIPTVDIAINQDLKALYPASNIDGRYLVHCLRFIEPKVDAVSVGSTVRGISVDQLMKFRVFAPPISEQRRIVEVLDAVDTRIRATERVIRKIALLRDGLISDLLNDGHRLARDEQTTSGSMHSQIPNDWSVGPIGQWCERMTVGVVNSATHAYVDNGVPFIRSQNVKPGRIDTRRMLYITDSYNVQQSSSILRAGDVLVVRTGYPGTAAVVPDELSGANCFSLLVVTPRRSALNPDYLALYLNSELCRRQISRLHFGSAQHNLNLAELKRLPILVPPLTRQSAIVDAARSAESRILKEQANVEKLRLLRLDLSTDLLTGRVRMPVEVTS